MQVGREQRGMQLGEAGFKELAAQLGRSVSAVYSQWLRVRTPQRKRRASTEGRGGKASRKTLMGRGRQLDDGVGDAVGDAAGASSERERTQREYELWKLTRENIALRAQVETLRECLGLFRRRRSEHRGGGGGYGSYGDYDRYERSASRSPPRGPIVLVR